MLKQLTGLNSGSAGSASAVCALGLLQPIPSLKGSHNESVEEQARRRRRSPLINTLYN